MGRMLAVTAVVIAFLSLSTSTVFGDPLKQGFVTPNVGFATVAQGGGMITRDGTLDVSVPPQAAPFDLQISFQVEDSNLLPGLPSGAFLQNPFQITIVPTNEANTLVTTTKPVTLTLHFTDSDVAGLAPASLRYVRQVDTLWVTIPSTLDLANKTITTQIDSSGSYGVVGSGLSTPPPAPAPAAAPAAAATPTSSTISGRVFYDKDGNGVMDGSDFPIAKAGIKISSGTFSAFTTTDDNGNYSFGGLGAGSYKVELVVGPEWAFTTPNAVGGISVTGQPDSRGAADFGMWYKLP